MNRTENDNKYQTTQFRRFNLQSPLTEFIQRENSPNYSNKSPSKITFATGNSPTDYVAYKINQGTLGRIPSFSKFVADYARIHGEDYKESLKSEFVKKI